MDDQLAAQLRKLAPTIDSGAAQVAFTAHRRRRRSQRRTTQAVLAMSAAVGCIFGAIAIADRSQDEVLITGGVDAPEALPPGEDTPPTAGNPTPEASIGAVDGSPWEPIGFEVLNSEQPGIQSNWFETVAAVVDEDELGNWWAAQEFTIPPPDVDFEHSVVVALRVPNPSGNACTKIASFEAARGPDGSVISLTPVLSPQDGSPCRWSFNPFRDFVVAINRSDVPRGFTLVVPANEELEFPETRLFVDVSIGDPATPLAPPTSESSNPELIGVADFDIEVLSGGQPSGGEMGTLRLAEDDAQYDSMWATFGLAAPAPDAALDRHVIVSITIPDDACPPNFAGLRRTGERTFEPIFVEPTDGCVEPLIPKVFVLALRRDQIAPGITIVLPGSDLYDYTEQRLIVGQSDRSIIRYGDQTPIFEPAPFATVPSSSLDPYDNEVAVSDGRLVAIDRVTSVATIVDKELGTLRTLGLKVVPGGIVLGPGGNVLYGFIGNVPADFAMAAIALDGPKAGEIVATNPLPINPYTEMPIGGTGQGSDGIIDRRGLSNGLTLIEYVDASGAPLPPGPPTVEFTNSAPEPAVDGTRRETISATDGSAKWNIGIKPSPGAADLSHTGEMPPAPTEEGGAVVFRYIGPRADPAEIDFGTPTGPAVAVLRADGSSQWYRLPQGWRVAASDVWGTVLARTVGDGLELAWLEVEGVRVR